MSRWEDVRPILVAAYDLIDDDDRGITNGKAIADALGTEDADLTRLARDLFDLREDGYIGAKFPMGSGPPPPHMITATQLGRQEVRGWPGPRTSAGNAELLVDLLRAQADSPRLRTSRRRRCARSSTRSERAAPTRSARSPPS